MLDKEADGVVVVSTSLVNDDGRRYGTLYLVFARTPRDVFDWIADCLDDESGKPYYQDRSIWDQIVVEYVTVYDHEGNLSRSPLWELLKMFADKHINVGPSTLKAIARLFP